jgi:hypothetical protein
MSSTLKIASTSVPEKSTQANVPIALLLLPVVVLAPKPGFPVNTHPEPEETAACQPPGQVPTGKAPVEKLSVYGAVAAQVTGNEHEPSSMLASES